MELLTLIKDDKVTRKITVKGKPETTMIVIVKNDEGYELGDTVFIGSENSDKLIKRTVTGVIYSLGNDCALELD